MGLGGPKRKAKPRGVVRRRGSSDESSSGSDDEAGSSSDEDDAVRPALRWLFLLCVCVGGGVHACVHACWPGGGGVVTALMPPP